MKNKQTAVDWLFEKLWNTPIDKLTWNSILKEAQKKEKQQIINAYITADSESTIENSEFYAEEFYNNNYKNDTSSSE